MGDFYFFSICAFLMTFVSTIFLICKALALPKWGKLPPRSSAKVFCLYKALILGIDAVILALSYREIAASQHELSYISY